MDSTKHKSSNAGRLARTFAKVLMFRTGGIASEHGNRRIKFAEVIKKDPQKECLPQESDEEEKLRNREAIEALLAKLFASLSAIKASYAQLQIAQSPYDPDIIQSADESVVSELKSIADLKHSYLKKQVVPSQENQMLDELREQQNLVKTFEIVYKKLQAQVQLKDSEVIFLQEKLQESEKQNKSLERRLNPSTSLSALDNLHFSALNPNYFIMVLCQVNKSIQSFVKLMIEEMCSSGWDLHAAATSIEPGAVFAKPRHRCFAFESYVCRKMFSDFQYPSFSEKPPKDTHHHHHHHHHLRRRFFESFMELKSTDASEFLSRNPKSKFGYFSRSRYLSLVHPKMESAFFGNTAQRNPLNSGEFPESAFFSAFLEMARRVWLLHRLAFSFEPEASIFQVRTGSRFSEVYMESACEDAPGPGAAPRVGFCVGPGFRVGKTVVQCRVYLVSGKNATEEA